MDLGLIGYVVPKKHTQKNLTTPKNITQILTNSKPKTHTDILFHKMDVLPFS